MRFVWRAAVKDLVRLVRDPLGLALWLAVPLAVGAAILLATGAGGGAGPTARVLLVDLDGGLAARLLAGALGQGGGSGLVSVETVGEAEGRARIARGEATALVVVPAGFGASVLAEEPVVLEVVTNPEQRILPAIVRGMLEVLAEAAFYLHRVAGEEVRAIAASARDGGGPADAEVAAIAAAVNRRLAAVADLVFPPRLRLETAVDPAPGEADGGAGPGMGALFLPGIVAMALLFPASALAGDVWREREQGTWRRAAVAPAGAARLLAGKLVSGGLVLGGMALVVLALGAPVVGVPLARVPAAAAWAALAGVGFLAGMLALQALASGPRAASILTTALLFPLLMLGGSFFPSEAMPGWMAAAGRLTPNGFAVERLKDLLLGRAEPLALAAAAGGTLVASALLLAVAARGLGRRLAAG